MKDLLEKICEYSLEDIMGDRFGSYSKYIIQDRAIPDVRDGLKPVQRRILYSMYKEKNTYDHGYRKSAKTVGDVIGNYHPHGDSSIYDAMVHMSQDWKFKNPYIDMHGNNGSIDGDSPAAYRYTEARLSKISNELLKDIDKDTVIFAPNFDDTTLEPTVLPARFPNLLVNGTMGISAGYATHIPTHNLGEVCDATIKRIDSPNCSLDTILKIIKGPDFPTGGIIEGLDGIKAAYETGRGKIIVKSKTYFENTKGKNSLIITEIPYEVNKALLVKKIDEIRIDKTIDGILEVRDESDKDGLRIAIDLKKEANPELILNYLLKNTDLQIAFNFNMVAIVDRRPKLLGILDILDAYILHQKEVVVRRTKFDLAHAESRYHICEGLIKCISILDDVIKTIRQSKNKMDARDNLVKEYDFTISQADAIIVLQLYRLTNTDVVQIETEMQNLEKIITGLKAILNNEEVLKTVMKEDLKKVKKEYNIPRKTEIQEEITDLKIDTSVIIPKEDVIVVITKDGYVKRTSTRSYNLSDKEIILKQNDYVLGLYQSNTTNTLLLFTSLGNYLYIPVFTIPDIKWKDLGKHVSNLIALEEDEQIISAIMVNNFDTNKNIITISKQGLIKQTKLSDFKVTRYNKTLCAMKLKDKDELIDAKLITGPDVFIATNSGYGLWFDVSEIPTTSCKSSGVKAIKLKANEYVVSYGNFDSSITEYITIVTSKATAKRIKITEFTKTNRAKRGVVLIREVKTNPYQIIKALLLNNKEYLGIKTNDIIKLKSTEITIADRYSTGSIISKDPIYDAFKISDKETLSEDATNQAPIKKQLTLEEIDNKLININSILKK